MKWYLIFKNSEPLEWVQHSFWSRDRVLAFISRAKDLAPGSVIRTDKVLILENPKPPLFQKGEVIKDLKDVPNIIENFKEHYPENKQIQEVTDLIELYSVLEDSDLDLVETYLISQTF